MGVQNLLANGNLRSIFIEFMKCYRCRVRITPLLSVQAVYCYYYAALRPSEGLGLLNYGRPFFSIDCLLSPSLNPYLPHILHIFQPSQSRSSLLLLPSGLLSNFHDPFLLHVQSILVCSV
jgi:hypothetical protein